jgi:hypothetical protein
MGAMLKFAFILVHARRMMKVKLSWQMMKEVSDILVEVWSFKGKHEHLMIFHGLKRLNFVCLFAKTKTTANLDTDGYPTLATHTADTCYPDTGSLSICYL